MMQRKLLLLNRGGGYASYITASNPLLWHRMRDTTGTTSTNSGSLGATGNGVIAGTTALAQIGKLGANEAFDFDGTTSIITVANTAALANMTTQRWMFLCKPDTLGEGNSGRLFSWGSFGANNHLFSLLATNNIILTVRGDGGADALAQTTSGIMADCIGAWCMIFGDYDDADALGLGRRCRMWKSVGGVVTPITTLANNTALTGNVRNQTLDLCLGNSSGVAQTFDGLFDEVVCNAGMLWTLAEITAIARAAGV